MNRINEALAVVGRIIDASAGTGTSTSGITYSSKRPKTEVQLIGESVLIN